jgi:hypothetical protein
MSVAACSSSTKASTTSVPTPVRSSSSSTATSSAMTSSTESPAKLAVDLGPADQVNLHGSWLKTAEACSFDANSARAWDVTLDYSPSGSLVSLFLIAVTADSREVRVSWDGYSGQPDQVVLAPVTTAFSSGGPKSITDYSMDSVLAAIDAVGARTMGEKGPICSVFRAICRQLSDEADFFRIKAHQPRWTERRLQFAASRRPRIVLLTPDL